MLYYVRLKKKVLDGIDIDAIYRNIYHYSLSLFCLVRRDYEIYDVNKAVVDTLGYEREELIGHPVWMLYSEKSKEILESVFAKCAENGIANTMVDANLKMGGNMNLELIVRLIRNGLGEPDSFLFIHRDVSESRKADAFMMLLLGIDQRIIFDTDRSKLLDFICKSVVDIIGVRFAWIGFKQSDGSVNPEVSFGSMTNILKEIEVRWDDSETGWVPEGRAIRTGMFQVINDCFTDPSFIPFRETAMKHGIRSVASIPITTKGVEAIGVLTLYSDKKDAFILKDIEWLVRIANQTCIALDFLKTKETLRESEEIRRTFMESATDGISLWDSKLNFIDANNYYLKNLGLKRDELVGKNITEIHLKVKESSRYDKHMETIKTGKPNSFETLIPNPDGGTRHLFVKVFKSGDGLGMLSRDITEHKKMENELRNAIDHFTVLVNSSESMILEIDRDWNVVFANARATKLLERGGKSIIGKKPTSIFPKNFAGDITDGFTRVFKTGLTHRYDSFLQINGKSMDVAVFINPINLTDGGIETAILTIRDITPRKAHEQMQMQNLALEESTRLKSEFVANMSHDLRTPLNTIIGYSELLSDQEMGELNEKQLEALSTVNASGNTLLSLINDILDISKIEANKLVLKIETLQVEYLVHKAKSANIPMAKEKQQRLDANAESGLVVWADELRVEQCLNNLVSNAIKFTPEKGHIQITAQKKNGMIELSVKDNGIGMPAGKIDKIFQSFYRINTTNKDLGGTGLGFAITQRLVETMGGNIRVESKEGKGTTFYFTLPTSRMGTGTKK